MMFVCVSGCIYIMWPRVNLDGYNYSCLDNIIVQSFVCIVLSPRVSTTWIYQIIVQVMSQIYDVQCLVGRYR